MSATKGEKKKDGAALLNRLGRASSNIACHETRRGRYVLGSVANSRIGQTLVRSRSALGGGAAAFTGLMDNTDVFFKLAKIVGVR